MRRILCLFAALMLFFPSGAAHAQRGDLGARFASEKSISLNGQTYRLRSRLTTALLMGIDQTSESSGGYRNGGHADFQLLIVVDDNRKTVVSLQLDRDTMTEITVLGVLGHVTGSRTAQLALAHAFGDGGQRSCELAVSAVEKLLLGTPVDEYFAMSMDGIAAFNDALGGIEVTLEDDFSAYDASMLPGVTLRLQGMQAEYYVRQRYYVGDQTNASRLGRQSVYLSKAKDVLREKLSQSPNFITTLFNAVEPYSVTSMSRGFLINLANKLDEYEVLPLASLAGTHKQGESGYMEFYPDEKCLQEFVIETFYEPAAW